jgi:anti-anti-sigma factor
MSTELFESEGFFVHVTQDDACVTVRCEGTSDARNPDVFLKPILQKLVESARDKRVTVDLSSLRYMNSASVTPLINLMKELNANDVPSVFLWDSKVSWQRANFLCMKTLARALPRVAVETL